MFVCLRAESVDGVILPIAVHAFGFNEFRLPCSESTHTHTRATIIIRMLRRGCDDMQVCVFRMHMAYAYALRISSVRVSVCLRAHRTQLMSMGMVKSKTLRRRKEHAGPLRPSSDTHLSNDVFFFHVRLRQCMHMCSTGST